MVKERVESLTWLRKRIEDADTSLLREMVKAVTEVFMCAEASVVCGAPYRQPRTDRVNQRNGYRARQWDTRVGTIDLAIPKLRKGSYFPDWLLEPRRRAERALMQVVTECYIRGVSTHRVDGLVRTLGLEGMSKSRVSELAKELDPVVASFRTRPLDDNGQYAFVWLDAMTQRCREGGRVINVVTAILARAPSNLLALNHVTTDSLWITRRSSLASSGSKQVNKAIGNVPQIGSASSFLSMLIYKCRNHFGLPVPRGRQVADQAPLGRKRCGLWRISFFRAGSLIQPRSSPLISSAFLIGQCVRLHLAVTLLQ